jgi:hypothetical protein
MGSAPVRRTTFHAIDFVAGILFGPGVRVSFVVSFCPTSKMSHDGIWRAPCRVRANTLLPHSVIMREHERDRS